MHAIVPVRFGRGRLDSLGNRGLAAYLIGWRVALGQAVEVTYVRKTLYFRTRFRSRSFRGSAPMEKIKVEKMLENGHGAIGTGAGAFGAGGGGGASFAGAGADRKRWSCSNSLSPWAPPKVMS